MTKNRIPRTGAAVAALVVALLGPGAVAADKRLVFEDLGEPVRVRELAMQIVTTGPGGDVAWGVYEAPDRHAMVGVRLDNGEVTWVDLTRFGRNHIQMIRGGDGNPYVYTGNPGHFLKYDVASGRLVDLGVPASPASYWLGSAVGPDGKIYGGTFSPAISFCCDTRSGTLTDLGPIANNKVQVYDTLSHPAGLFLSGYMPASVDFFDPALPVKAPGNPRHVVSVAGQERPVQLALGPDGMIYSGTFPSKGRLGGALLRVNPNDFSCRVWTNVISNQSLFGVAPVPELGGVFCTASIQGGSSAIPTEKEAFVFLWDCTREAVAYRAQPLPGAAQYGAVVRARSGLLYGVAGLKYYAFDPVRQKVVFTGALPVKGVHFPELSDEPAGPRGLIYGLGDDAVFAIDPADHSVKIVARDKSLGRAMGFFVTPDETLYYGSGSRLMRVRLGNPAP